MDHIDPTLSDSVIDFLKREHTGRDKPIPYRDVMKHFCVASDGKDDHAFRKLYENRVGSCPGGIFYIAHGNWREALWWKSWLARTYKSNSLAEKKYNALLSMRKDLAVPMRGEQPDLPYLDAIGGDTA
jgi:hypothetical protein